MTAVSGLIDEKQLEAWPDEAWRRLIAAVANPARVWVVAPRCECCGRPLAAPDCEPDALLCWGDGSGGCAPQR